MSKFIPKKGFIGLVLDAKQYFQHFLLVSELDCQRHEKGGQGSGISRKTGPEVSGGMQKDHSVRHLS